MQNLLRVNDWRLSVKLAVAMLLLAVLSLAASNTISSLVAANSLERTIGDELTKLAELQGARVGDVIAAQVSLLNGKATDDAIVGASEESNDAYTGSQQAILDSILALDAEWQAAPEAGIPLIDQVLETQASEELREFVAGASRQYEVFATDRYGASASSSGRTSDYYQADEDWWQAGWNNGQGALYIGPPAFDESAGVMALEVVLPVADVENNEVVGVMKGVISVDATVGDIPEFQIGTTGHAMVVAPDGTYIAAPEEMAEEVVLGSPVEEGLLLNGRILSGTGYDFNATGHSGEPNVVAYAPVTTAGVVPEIDQMGWVVLVHQDRTEALATIRQLRTIATATGFGAALAAAGLAILLSRFLTRQVDEMDRVFRSAAVGNFDARAEVLGRDELGRAAEGLNAMLGQFTGLLDSTEAERTKAEAERTRAEAAVSTLVGTVDQTAASAQVADRAALSAQEGDEAVRRTVAAMERIRDNTQETARRMKRLGEASQEISEVVRLIEELSDRTTVLALNASIQAAAAGEAGRGFAVVAEEVQRLAERATGETRRIEDLVKTIQSETSEAVVGVEDATREVVEGSQVAQTAGERMEELGSLVFELAALIQHLADTTSQEVGGTERVPVLEGVADSAPIPGGDGNGMLAQAGEAGDGVFRE